MKKFRLPIILLVAVLLAMLTLMPACRKEIPDPTKGLPPATQTGANTFGCVINGRTWKPKGRFALFSLNLDASYYTDNEGSFTVRAYQYNPDTDVVELIGFSIDTISKGTGLRVYRPEVGSNKQTQAILFTYNDLKGMSYYNQDSGVYCAGKVNMTRIDVPHAIFSGTFAFTLKAPDSDTVKITDGRFDIRIGGSGVRTN